MLRSIIAVTLSSLALPVLAQGPAIEGQGSQTQSVELLNGSVSVQVGTSGEVSLGRGEPSISGGLGVSVNDLGVGIGDNAPSSAEVHSPISERSDTGPIGSVDRLDAAEAGSCTASAPAQADLLQAIERGYAVRVGPADCAANREEIADLLQSAPELSYALEAAGFASQGIVSITIAEQNVMIGY